MAEEKKVFDVARPGKTKADSTAKPVIIGHKVLVSDGTVTPSGDALTTTPAGEVIAPAEEPKLSPVGEKTLTPSAELVEQVKQDKASGAEQAKEVGETKSALPESEPTSEPKKPKDDEPNSDEPAKPDAKPAEKPPEKEADASTVLGEAGTVKEAEIADLERQEKVKKLVDEGKYALPIGQPKGHHGNVGLFSSLLILFIVFVLTVAGFALAIDAGLIDSNYDLPFDLIKTAN